MDDSEHIPQGWGENPYEQWNHANAVHLGKTPVADELMAKYPHVLIHTSGEDVGLPDGVMGNSEVDTKTSVPAESSTRK